MRYDGFNGIEPLGGVSDKSRDSILLRNGENVIFHYSVRKDWKAKLWKDSEGVRRHGHTCTRIVCVNPAKFSTAERDNCVREFGDRFGWSLELYGVERIASMLRSNAASLLHKYPQIFVPHLISENRTASVEVRINPTRDKRRQLAQIIGYNCGPGPVLIEAWYVEWSANGSLKLNESVQCYRGRLPLRLEEKARLDITVPLDFEWEGLVKIGLVDAERHRFEATEENIKRFVGTARQYMPPPRESAENELTLELIQSQQLSVDVRKDRQPGSKHDRLLVVFRNQGTLPLKAERATIEWKFDTEKALAENSHIAGPNVVPIGANVELRCISPNKVSSNGSDVHFVLEESMASVLIEIVTRSDEINVVQAAVLIAPGFKLTETENVRAVVVSVAKSVLDTWD